MDDEVTQAEHQGTVDQRHWLGFSVLLYFVTLVSSGIGAVSLMREESWKFNVVNVLRTLSCASR